MHLVCFRAGSLCGFRPSWMLTNLRPFLYLMQYSNSRTASVPSSHRYPGLNKKDWVISITVRDLSSFDFSILVKISREPLLLPGSMSTLPRVTSRPVKIPLLNMSIFCVFWVLLAQRWWIVQWFCWFRWNWFIYFRARKTACLNLATLVRLRSWRPSVLTRTAGAWRSGKWLRNRRKRVEGSNT